MGQGKNNTGIYSLIQGLYWMVFCAIVSFAALYLLAEGFSALAIGAIMAVANILGALLQPLLADFSDRTQKVTLSGLILLLSLPGLMAALALFFAEGLLAALLFTLLIAISFLLMPVVNAMGMYYNEGGAHCDFGVARAVGSLAYAIVSALLGILLAAFGNGILPLAIAALFGAFILVMLGTPTPMAPREREEAAAAKGAASLFALRSTYPGFLLVLCGVVLIAAFHNLSNTYLIQILETLGGSAREMGITISLAALLELPAMLFYSRFQRRFSAARILQFSGLFWVLKALAYLLAGQVGQLYAAQFFHALSFALFAPAMVYYSHDRMLGRDKVKGQAFMTAAASLGNVLGSLSGGMLLDGAGMKAMLGFGLILSALGALALIQGIRVGERGEAGTGC